MPSLAQSVGDTNDDRGVVVVWAAVRRNCASWFWWFVDASVIGDAVGDAVGNAVVGDGVGDVGDVVGGRRSKTMT